MFGYPDGRFAVTSHHNANVLVTFEDLDHASVCTSVYAWHQRADGSTPRLWGYYHDSVVRLPEGWRIAGRQLRTLGAEDWNMEMHWALDGEPTCSSPPALPTTSRTSTTWPGATAP
jgi:hypothetical protein